MNDRNPYRPAAYSASPYGPGDYTSRGGRGRGRGSADEEDQRYDRSPGIPSPGVTSPYRDVSPFGDGDGGGGGGGGTPVYNNMRSRGRGGESEEVEMRLQGGGYAR